MRRFLISLVLLALLVTACQAKATVSPTRSVLPPTQTAIATSTATVAPLGGVATRAPIPTNTSAGVPPGCRIVSFLPTADPTTVGQYPPVTSKDWVKGPADASLTLIEYSDFM